MPIINGWICVMRNERRKNGLTLVELVITMTISTVVLLAVGILLVDGQRGWQQMYHRTNSNVVGEGFVAQKTFDRVIRKASRDHFLVDPSGQWVEVYYYQDSTSLTPDRYALFYVSNQNLKVEYGTLDPKTAVETQTLCSAVSSCRFQASSGSVQMALTLDNQVHSISVFTSAIMHN